MFIKKNKKKKKVLFLAISMFSFLHAAEPVEVFKPHTSEQDHTQGYKPHEGRPQEAQKHSDMKLQSAPLLESSYKKNSNGIKDTSASISLSLDTVIDSGLGTDSTASMSPESRSQKPLTTGGFATSAGATYQTDEFAFGSIPGPDTPQKPLLSTQELGKRLDRMQNLINYGQNSAKGAIGGTIDPRQGIESLKELATYFDQYEEKGFLNEFKKTKLLLEEAVSKGIDQKVEKSAQGFDPKTVTQARKDLADIGKSLDGKIAMIELPQRVSQEQEFLLTEILSLYGKTGESDRDQDSQGLSKAFTTGVDTLFETELNKFNGAEDFDNAMRSKILILKNSIQGQFADSIVIGKFFEKITKNLKMVTSELEKNSNVQKNNETQTLQTVQPPVKDFLLTPIVPLVPVAKSVQNAVTEEQRSANEKLAQKIEKQLLSYKEKKQIEVWQKEVVYTYSKEKLQLLIDASGAIKAKIQNGLTELDKIAQALTPDQTPLKNLCNQRKGELQNSLEAIEAQQTKWNAILNPMLRIGTRSDVQKKDPLRSYDTTDDFGDFGAVTSFPSEKPRS